MEGASAQTEAQRQRDFARLLRAQSREIQAMSRVLLAQAKEGVVRCGTPYRVASQISCWRRAGSAPFRPGGGAVIEFPA
jgi:hypothetical protein